MYSFPQVARLTERLEAAAAAARPGSQQPQRGDEAVVSSTCLRLEALCTDAPDTVVPLIAQRGAEALVALLASPSSQARTRTRAQEPLSARAQRPH